MSLFFDDADNRRVIIPDITTARFTDLDAWSYLAFVKFNSLASLRTVCSKYQTFGARQFYVAGATDGSLEVFFRFNTFNTPASIISTGVWYVVAVVNNGGGGSTDVTAYVINMDGSIAVSQTGDHGNDNSSLTSDIRYGLQQSSNNRMNGSIAYSAYVTSELKQSQVQEFAINPYRVVARHGAAFFHPLPFQTVTQPDWSGKGNPGTQHSSPTTANNPPIAPLVGYDISYVPSTVGADLVKASVKTEQILEQLQVQLGLIRNEPETEEITEQARVLMSLVRESTETEEITEQARALLDLVRVASLETEEIVERVARLLAALIKVTETVNIAERAYSRLFLPLLPPPQDPTYNPLLGAVSPNYVLEHASPVAPVYTVPGVSSPVFVGDSDTTPRFNTPFHLIQTGFEVNEQQDAQVFRSQVLASSGNYSGSFASIVNPLGLRVLRFSPRTFPYGPGVPPNIESASVRSQYFRLAEVDPQPLDPQVNFKIVYSFWWAVVAANFLGVRFELLYPLQQLSPPTGVHRFLTLSSVPPEGNGVMVKVSGEYTPPVGINNKGGDYQLRLFVPGTPISGGGTRVAIDDLNVQIVPTDAFPEYHAAHGTPVQI